MLIKVFEGSSNLTILLAVASGEPCGLILKWLEDTPASRCIKKLIFAGNTPAIFYTFIKDKKIK
jgi:hypothetical protein